MRGKAGGGLGKANLRCERVVPDEGGSGRKGRGRRCKTRSRGEDRPRLGPEIRKGSRSCVLGLWTT